MKPPFFELDLLRFRDRVKTRHTAGRPELFDPVRKKWMKMEPEEWVRQLLIRYLVSERDASVSRMASEKNLKKLPDGQRFDLGLYDRKGQLALLAECKSFKIPLNAKAIGQLSRYNRKLQSRVLLWTNGKLCCSAELQPKTGVYRYVNSLPEFGE